MRAATVSVVRHRVRLFLAGIAFAACLSGTGCARVRSFRQDKGPAFGTDVAARDSSDRRGAKTADLYADRFIGTPPVPRETAEADTPERKVPEATQPPKVALRAPIELPAFTKPEPADPGPVKRAEADPKSTAVASNGAKPAWSTPAESRTGLTLETVLGTCRGKLNALDTYQVSMNHQERVSGKLNPAENVLMSIKRNPKSVRLEWREGANQGREVLYAADQGNGLMHVRMGGNALLPRISMAPDSPMATHNSRHPITEAGFDTILERMEEGLKLSRSGTTSDRITYDGLKAPEGVDKVCHKIERVTSDGETWQVYLDPKSFLPVLVRASATNGDLLEQYVYGETTISPADLASAEAFNADARWGPAKGLFSRLAKAAADNAESKTR